MNEPTITVITVVKNGASILDETIQSVLAQKYAGIQYVIVDGASIDGTIDVIRGYQDHIAAWISEKDEGVYHGMNKAIGFLRGGGHVFLNAGDRFVGQVFGSNMTLPCRLPVRYVDPFGLERTARQPSRRTGLPFFHQGMVFESKGILYDTRYRISADYQYYLDHGYRGLVPEYPTDGYVYFDSMGMNTRFRQLRDRELTEIIRRHFGSLTALRFAAYVASKNAIRPLLRTTGLWRRGDLT